MSKLWSVVSGDAYEIKACCLDEAEKKYEAYYDSDPCPCGNDECDCVLSAGEVQSLWAEITPPKHI